MGAGRAPFSVATIGKVIPCCIPGNAVNTRSKPFRIAVIPGDGIGREVMPEGLRALQAAARRFDIALSFTEIEWASCDYHAKTGQMMPDADQMTEIRTRIAFYLAWRELGDQ